MTRPLVSPDLVAREMSRVQVVAIAANRLAAVVVQTYEELYDASLRASSTGDGIPPGKQGFHVTDPTGDVATSGMHARLRWEARRVASKLRKVENILAEAESLMVEAFAETDPDFREKLLRLREFESALDAGITRA